MNKKRATTIRTLAVLGLLLGLLFALSATAQANDIVLDPQALPPGFKLENGVIKLTDNYTIASGVTLILPNYYNLCIDNAYTLTIPVDAKVQIGQSARLTVGEYGVSVGTLQNNGVVNNFGTVYKTNGSVEGSGYLVSATWQTTVTWVPMSLACDFTNGGRFAAPFDTRASMVIQKSGSISLTPAQLAEVIGDLANTSGRSFLRWNDEDGDPATTLQHYNNYTAAWAPLASGMTIAGGGSPEAHAGGFTSGSSLTTRLSGKQGAGTVTFTATIKNAPAATTATATASADTEALVFTFTREQMNALPVRSGGYDIEVTCPGDADNSALTPTKIGTVTINKAAPTFGGSNTLTYNKRVGGDLAVAITQSGVFYADTTSKLPFNVYAFDQSDELGRFVSLTTAGLGAGATEVKVTTSAMGGLNAGKIFDLYVQMPANANNASSPVVLKGCKVGTLTVIDQNVNPDPVHISVTGVTISAASARVGIGHSAALTATVAPSNATNRAVAWSSSDASVAKVDGYGLVTAEGLGVATITVTTSDGGYTARCQVTVTPPASVSGNNQLTALPGSSFPLAFTVEVANNEEKPVAITLTVGDNAASAIHTGDGTVVIPCLANFVSAGAYPVTASLSGGAPVQVGTVHVVEVSKYLKGDLASVLGAGFLYGRASAGVPMAFRSASASLDTATNLLTVQNKDALTVGIAYTGTGRVAGRLVKMQNNPFAASGKALQPIPNRAHLMVYGKVNASKKYAGFTFDARAMYRLEPGYYQFEVASGKNGRYKGFPYTTLATIRVTEGKGEAVEWTMPASLRASIGQQYQLVTPVIAGATLPTLAVASSDKRVATIDTAGILTAKRSGKVTIKVRTADGSVQKCTVTVAANSFSRTRPLLVKGQAGLYASTRRLYEKSGALNAEIFLYNRTGQTIKGLDHITFELYDGQTLIHHKDMQPITFKTALKNKGCKVLKFSLTDAILPGVSAKELDLGIGRYTAVVRCIDSNAAQAVILKSGAIGTATAKSNEVKWAGSERLMQLG